MTDSSPPPNLAPEKVPDTAPEIALGKTLTTEELAEIMQVVMRVGELMLRSGTVSFRVEQGMGRVARSLGIGRLDAYVTLTGITATAHCRNQHYTEIARIKTMGIDMNRLSLIEAMANTIPPNTNPQAIAARLDAIEQTPPLYPRPWVIGWVAIACGAFAILAGGSWAEFLAATVGAAFSLSVRDRLAAGRLNPIAITVFCAAIASLLCQWVITGLGQVGLSTDTPEFGLLSSVLFLVPGVALVTAALDLVRFDLVSGMSRLAYAILLLTSIAVGMLITLAITGTQVI